MLTESVQLFLKGWLLGFIFTLYLILLFVQIFVGLLSQLQDATGQEPELSLEKRKK